MKDKEKERERIRGCKVGRTLIHYERGLSHSLSRFTHYTKAKGKKCTFTDTSTFLSSPFTSSLSLSRTHTMILSISTVCKCIKFHATTLKACSRSKLKSLIKTNNVNFKLTGTNP